jgi:hypothetical protein
VRKRSRCDLVSFAQAINDEGMTSSLRVPTVLVLAVASAISACATGETTDSGVRRDAHTLDAPGEQLDVFIPTDTGPRVDGGALPDTNVTMPDTGMPASDTGVDAFAPADAGNDGGRDSGPSCVDRDGDGAFIGPASCGPTDCDDTLASRRPGAVELCNNVDDNCNGTLDDGIATQTCGVGACVRTVPGCMGGLVPVCTPGAAAPETCNNRDDNCNGAIDDGLASLTCGVGPCMRTVPSCVAGAPQSCSPGPAGVESCNGIDDDCDTLIDDGFAPVTCGVGLCQRTVNSCMSGVPQSCVPGTAVAEVCNNLDDNCDGLNDNGISPLTCGVGACARTVTACVAGVPQSCVPGSASGEICGNGVDENCNGLADDGCSTITNDLCTSPTAIDMALPTATLSGTTAGAVNNVSGGCGCSSGSDVFYSFTLARTEYVWANTLGTSTAFDGSLFFTDAGCAALPARTLPELVCDDDGGPLECGSLQSQIFAVLAPGTYRLAVSGCGSGAFNVNFAHYPVGSVGNGGAVAAGSSTVTGSLPAAVGASPTTCGGNGAERSYYWLTCPSTAAGTFTASTCTGSSFDTYLAAYHTNTTQACADDSCGVQSSISQSLPAGVGFHVVYMDAYSSSDSGTYTLAMSRP